MLVEPDNQQETIKPETKNLGDNEQLYDIVDPDPYGIYMNQEESELQYDILRYEASYIEWKINKICCRYMISVYCDTLLILPEILQ